MNTTLVYPKEKRIKEGFAGQEMIVLPPSIRRSIAGNELIKRLYVTAIGFYPYARHHNRVRKLGSNQYILLYCIKGQGTIQLQDREISLSPNTFFIIPRQVAHQYKSSAADPWSIYWAHFAGDHADILYLRYLEKGKETQIPYLEKRLQLFNEILAILNGGFKMREMEIANIKFFELISSMIYPQEACLHSAEGDMVSSSIQFMKENLASVYSVEELAYEQHSSVSRYSRLFHKKMGSSPINYFNQLKVQKSCLYLYLTDKTIKEICKELGFNDPYYFSRLFKKIMGVSPANYKLKYKR